jgi:hypothetical protein
MADLTTTLVPAGTCPSCSYQLDACSGAGTPAPGDLSLCWACGEVLTFDGELRQRRCPESQLGELDPETRAWVREAQVAIRLRRARGEAARA